MAFRCPVPQRTSFRKEARTHLTSFDTTPKFLPYQMLEFWRTTGEASGIRVGRTFVRAAQPALGNLVPPPEGIIASRAPIGTRQDACFTFGTFQPFTRATLTLCYLLDQPLKPGNSRFDMLTIGILQGWRIRVLGLLMAAFENSGRRLCLGRLAKRTKRLKLDERPDKLGWAPVLFEPQAVSVGRGRQAPK
jgi:hypothetical protein